MKISEIKLVVISIVGFFWLLSSFSFSLAEEFDAM
jgi:hypothetical protein